MLDGDGLGDERRRRRQGGVAVRDGSVERAGGPRRVLVSRYPSTAPAYPVGSPECTKDGLNADGDIRAGSGRCPGRWPGPRFRQDRRPLPVHDRGFTIGCHHVADERASRRTSANRTAISGERFDTDGTDQIVDWPVHALVSHSRWEYPRRIADVAPLEERPGGAFHLDGAGVGVRIPRRADRDPVGDRGDSSNPERRDLIRRPVWPGDDLTGQRHRTIDHNGPGVGRVHTRRPRRLRCNGVPESQIAWRIRGCHARQNPFDPRSITGPKVPVPCRSALDQPRQRCPPPPITSPPAGAQRRPLAAPSNPSAGRPGPF